MFKGKEWQKCILMTAFVFPGWVFFMFFVVNLFVWHEGSSGAVPFGSMFAVLSLWMGISVPLTFLGAYFGSRKPAIEPKTAVSPFPREIPPQVWYLRSPITVMVGGVLPFGAVFVELFFILSSLWLDQFYYVYGFLVIVFAILVVTCAELTIVMIYFQLCAEDYRWCVPPSPRATAATRPPASLPRTHAAGICERARAAECRRGRGRAARVCLGRR